MKHQFPLLLAAIAVASLLLGGCRWHPGDSPGDYTVAWSDPVGTATIGQETVALDYRPELGGFVYTLDDPSSEQDVLIVVDISDPAEEKSCGWDPDTRQMRLCLCNKPGDFCESLLDRSVLWGISAPDINPQGAAGNAQLVTTDEEGLVVFDLTTTDIKEIEQEKRFTLNFSRSGLTGSGGIGYWVIGTAKARFAVQLARRDAPPAGDGCPSAWATAQDPPSAFTAEIAVGGNVLGMNFGLRLSYLRQFALCQVD